MNEVEIERLVVSLRGDSAHYEEMLARAQEETTTAAAAINKEVESISAISTQVDEVMSAIVEQKDTFATFRKDLSAFIGDLQKPFTGSTPISKQVEKLFATEEDPEYLSQLEELQETVGVTQEELENLAGVEAPTGWVEWMQDAVTSGEEVINWATTLKEDLTSADSVIRQTGKDLAVYIAAAPAAVETGKAAWASFITVLGKVREAYTFVTSINVVNVFTNAWQVALTTVTAAWAKLGMAIKLVQANTLLFAAGGAVAIAGLVAATYAISEYYWYLEKVNTIIEDMGKKHAKVWDPFKEETTKIGEALKQVFGAGERQEFAAPALDDAKKKLVEIDAQIKDTKRQLATAESADWFGLGKAVKVIKAELENLQKARGNVEDRIKVIAENMVLPKGFQDQLDAQLREQDIRGRLLGKQPEEAVIARMQAQLPDTAELTGMIDILPGELIPQMQEFVAEIEAASKRVDLLAVALTHSALAAKAFKVESDLEQITKGLTEHAQALGLSGRELQLYNIQLAANKLGVSLGVKELQAAKAAIKEAGVVDEFKRLQEQGKQLNEQFSTPQDKFDKQIDNLNKMLDVGVITWATYGKAVDQVRKNLQGAGREAANASANFAAAASDSAEAITRMEDFLSRNRLPGADGVGAGGLDTGKVRTIAPPAPELPSKLTEEKQKIDGPEMIRILKLIAENTKKKPAPPSTPTVEEQPMTLEEQWGLPPGTL